MELEIAASLAILFVLVFLATVDMAFSQLSDLSLRRPTLDDVFLTLTGHTLDADEAASTEDAA